jgi:hypothetical protein
MEGIKAKLGRISCTTRLIVPPCFLVFESELAGPCFNYTLPNRRSTAPELTLKIRFHPDEDWASGSDYVPLITRRTLAD